ncbi:BTB/POZ domain-containing protein 3-like [Mizuhopecten yessoensis]|uniref:BTB/POZ domain-containing protein 3 n=1 Tax=Mizuhopecten yessoensis TaxID=6573 RepID=A0A210QHH9_MIZYE|nr:BTB/POZ domain-containing protein 3-like [Mizuhopecten yessoensis]XP_021357914.1 BTB/POZ domain-containing protein 3-like [Mizuhopecten yessoensis]OWF48235.1 BTB/POZ domain-containing protein 3 [Mizuhopecten yessoensis]
MAERGTEPQNWRDGRTLTQCNRYMLEQEISCDVHFIVGPNDDQQRIGAHKYMLMTRSDVFFAMFEGLMAEENSLVTIPDIDPTTFKKMLLYIYCDDTGVDTDEAFPLLYAAQKYNIQGLVNRCGQRMRTGISRENVCHILINTFLWHEEETKQACVQYINLHASDVFSTEGFTDLPEESLIELLQHHKLNIQEERIFEAVIKWADEKIKRQNLRVDATNRRNALNKILPHIRFARMDVAYFSDKVTHKGILTTSEIVKYFQFLTTKKADPPEPQREQRLVFERFKGVLSGKGYFRGNTDAISFMLSEDAKLHEVLVYGSCMNQALYKMNLRVLEDGGAELHLKVFDLRTDGSTKTYPLGIVPPVLVKKEVCYSLVMEITGPASYYGQDGVESLTKEEVTITFCTNKEGLNGTNIKQGQFHSLVFEKIQSIMTYS